MIVGRVVLEHIENELLLDGLPHGVEAERFEGAIRLFGAKLLQCLRLGCGRVGEIAYVLLRAASLELFENPILDRLFLFFLLLVL